MFEKLSKLEEETRKKGKEFLGTIAIDIRAVITDITPYPPAEP